MSLVKCKECGSQVSSKAETCPHCGLKKTVKNNDLLTFIFASVIVVWIISNLSNKTDQQQADSSGVQPIQQQYVEAKKEIEIVPEMIFKLKDGAVICKDDYTLEKLIDHAKAGEKTLAKAMIGDMDVFFFSLVGWTTLEAPCFVLSRNDSLSNGEIYIDDLQKFKWRILKVDKLNNVVTFIFEDTGSFKRRKKDSSDNTLKIFIRNKPLAVDINSVLPIDSDSFQIEEASSSPAVDQSALLNKPEGNNKAVEAKQIIFSDNPEKMPMFVARAEWGNEIKAVITKNECKDQEFLDLGYYYAIDSGLPIKRTKRKSDYYYSSKGIAYTVQGCWQAPASMPTGMVKAKMRRKHDNKVWDMDINLNDGSWVKE